MKVKILLVWAMVLFQLGSVFGQVSGKVTLVGESDHSGVKIKFIAKSPTAKTDSILTTSTGSYSKKVENGIYSIEISKAGYETFINEIASSILINETKVLSEVYLITKTNSLTENLSGTIHKGDYFLVKDAKIDSGQTLTIEPGTRILVAPGKKIEVAGKLNAVGTQSDSIYLGSMSHLIGRTDKWEGIEISGRGNIELGFSNVSNANFLIKSNASTGLEIHKDIIRNNFIHSVKEIIKGSSSLDSLFILNNTFKDFEICFYIWSSGII